MQAHFFEFSEEQQVSGGIEMGANLCGATTTCP